MMKKLFSGGGNDKSSWVGKVLHVGRHQCLIEEIIAEGKLLSSRHENFIQLYLFHVPSVVVTLSDAQYLFGFVPFFCVISCTYMIKD